ncbi:hypothetical protein EMGBS6_17180 [Opitutia bacterium]|nr:hypothetical protein EMGBS6_17180 [Opitutae bacterium]
MGGLMSASAAVLSLLQAAQGKGQVSASSLANAGIAPLRCPAGRRHRFPERSLRPRGLAGDRGPFLQGYRFRTRRHAAVAPSARVSAANELDSQGLPVRAAIGSACLTTSTSSARSSDSGSMSSATQPGPASSSRTTSAISPVTSPSSSPVPGASSAAKPISSSGARSTPQLSFTVRHLGAHAGVVITREP